MTYNIEVAPAQTAIRKLKYNTVNKYFDNYLTLILSSNEVDYRIVGVNFFIQQFFLIEVMSFGRIFHIIATLVTDMNRIKPLQLNYA